MIRTRFNLDEHEYELVKQRSRELGVSIAEFIRRAVRDALPTSEGGDWMRFVGFVDSGDPKSSRSIDDIVYGTKD